MSATYGPMSPLQFATYDPDTCSWRMSGDTYLWDSGTYSAIWPASGMTRSGVSYELPQQEHLTDESGCSSLLPTPVASEGIKATQRQNASQKAKTGQVWLSNVARTLQEYLDNGTPLSDGPRNASGDRCPPPPSLLDAMEWSA